MYPRAACNMGVGCDEAGICYAEVMGEPGRCPRQNTSGEGITAMLSAGQSHDRSSCIERSARAGNAGSVDVGSPISIQISPQTSPYGLPAPGWVSPP